MKGGLVVFSFAAAAILSLAAGLAGGMLLARLPAIGSAEPATAPAGDPSLRQLNLTSAQQQKMKAIWQNVQQSAQESYRDARRCENERDRKLEALLNDEQKKAYGKITQDYVAEYGAAKARRDAAFREAVEKTRQLLSPDQRQRYDQILKAKLGGGESAGVETSTALSSHAQ